MANVKHEDAIMKMGFDYFRDTILKSLGIDYEFADLGITELVELTIHSLYMDFTFLTVEGFYVHIEFQTTDGGDKDLRRFHAYEAVYSHKTGRSVRTYVIYSGGITKVETDLDCGWYIYRINPIYLRNQDADIVIERLKKKQMSGKAFTEEDYANLSLTPLMSGKMSRKEILKEAILLAKRETKLTAEKTMAMLYALADKFLDGAELEEIKEVVALTKIGQMLLNEGIERGMERGIEQGIERGIERGMERGIEQGLKQGLEQGRDAGTAEMAALSRKLLDENRLEDLKRATEDPEFRQKLLSEMIQKNK